MIVSNWQYKIPSIIRNPGGVKTTTTGKIATSI